MEANGPVAQQRSHVQEDPAEAAAGKDQHGIAGAHGCRIAPRRVAVVSAAGGLRDG